MKQLIALLLLAALLGCRSGPVPRDWQVNAHEALDTALETWLTGNNRLAEAELARAKYEVAATGRLDMQARVVLVRCAAEVASLTGVASLAAGTVGKAGGPDPDGPACLAFQALAQDATPADRAYFAYLAGRWQGIAPDLLPAWHRAILTGAGDAKQLQAMTDPLARLVAAAVLLQRTQLTPDGIAVAVDTASAQGWRRPLLAWLGVAAQRASATGDTALAEAVKKRMALVERALGAP
jgi:hypothetical protein